MISNLQNNRYKEKKAHQNVSSIYTWMFIFFLLTNQQKFIFKNVSLNKDIHLKCLSSI